MVPGMEFNQGKILSGFYAAKVSYLYDTHSFYKKYPHVEFHENIPRS